MHAVLKSSQSGLELSHYFRLIGLATADIVFGLPISLYFFTFNVQFLVPWGSWSRVHYDWMRVSTFSEEQVLPYPAASVKHYLSRWLCPLLCFVFFLFCGVGDDAIKQYRNWLRGAAKLLPDGWTPNPNTRCVRKMVPADSQAQNRLCRTSNWAQPLFTHAALSGRRHLWRPRKVSSTTATRRDALRMAGRLL